MSDYEVFVIQSTGVDVADTDYSGNRIEKQIDWSGLMSMAVPVSFDHRAANVPEPDPAIPTATGRPIFKTVRATETA